MTLPKPYEVETGELSAPPPEHHPLLLGPLVRSCVVPEDGAVVIAGATARIADDEAPELVASRLRLTLLDRFLERAPNADADTWQLFLTRAAEVVRSNEPVVGDELSRLLTQTIDGL